MRRRFFATSESEAMLPSFPTAIRVPVFPELHALPAPWSAERDWYTVNLVSRSDTKKVRYQSVRPDRFIIDKSESPVVEWGRSMRRGTKLKEGRFWMAGTPAAKTDSAVALFEDLRKWLRKNCTRSERGGILVGPEAAPWAAEGGQLILGQDPW